MSSGSVQFVNSKTLHVRCIKCNICLRKSHGQRLKIKTEDESKRFSRILKKRVIVGDMFCNKCRAAVSFNFQKIWHSKESSVGTSAAATSLTTASSTGTSRTERVAAETSSLQTSLSESDLLSSSTEDPSFVANASNTTELDIECIEMPFSRVISSHGYCFVCGSKKNHQCTMKRLRAFRKCVASS